MAKDKFDWSIGDKGEIYITCKNCHKVFVWKPYNPKRFRGMVGRFEIPHAEEYYEGPCKYCEALYVLYSTIGYAEQFHELEAL